MIPLSPNDPLYAETANTGHMMVIARANLDNPDSDYVDPMNPVELKAGVTPIYNNNTGLSIDQSQTYGSDPSVNAFLREYDKVAKQCAAEGIDHSRYLLRLVELELIDRERRMVERRIKQARFPTTKSLDSFQFKALPSLNKVLVTELARCDYINSNENIIAVGNSGTGKTHIALGLGLAACQKGLAVGFITASALMHELLEARDEKRLIRLQKQLAKYKLLIIDELGYVPLSPTGAELLFEVFSQRYERGSTIVTSNLPFDEWTATFGSERLTGALLDRLTHHVHILEMNGESFRLKRKRPASLLCLNYME